jgi:hypothetical protein
MAQAVHPLGRSLLFQNGGFLALSHQKFAVEAGQADSGASQQRRGVGLQIPLKKFERKRVRNLYAIVIACMVMASTVNAQSMDGQMMDHSKMDHAAHMAMMADAQRQSEVANRGKDVMPFTLAATTHIFTKDAKGGIQRVVAKKSNDTAQIKLVRKHLQEIREQFLQGDFSGPSHIHGQDMPGLAALKAAKPGQIDISYKDVKGGAELRYKTPDAELVTALHQWFDAQLSDHGKDAMEGHNHADMMK